MAVPGIKSTRTVSFPEARYDEERMAAVLVNKAEDGTLRAYVADIPGREQPDPEAIALLVQSVELSNL